MTKKELIINGINTYKNYSDWEDKLANLGINIWENDIVQELLMNYVEMLNFIAGEEHKRYDPTNIEYFMFDTNYGEYADEYFITDEDGNEFKFYTVEDLWNYLAKINPSLEK